jgi:hypothetical protein
MNSYSYRDILEDGIEVCASCGSANIENNQIKHTKSKPPQHCYDCDYAEGTSICMPDDKYFYNQAKETLNKMKASK